uniref:Putative dna-binding bright/brcaa1/rbp1 n=1 Tax=Corethrella appendiculata TaxID=1370023 RepID=W4VRS1_9DIPT
MQQIDDPPYLNVGTEVSAKYKGAFCEAKVRKVVRNIKCKVAYKQPGIGSSVVSDDQIKGALRVGATVEVKHPDRKEYAEATLTKIQDCSQYTVVFDDGDITTLRRSALCLKSGRHFNESETLDQLPLTHPEHFGNPVIGGRRGRRSRHLLQDESSDDDDDQPINPRARKSDREENIGKVVCVEGTDTKKKGPKENWFPGLVVAPTAQDTVRIRVKDEYLVRSFKDGRYYTVPKKEANEFTREMAKNQDGQAIQAALEYLDNDSLPTHWDRDALFGASGSSSDYEQEYESDSSDDEPTEEKDHFVAQLYKFMDDRGTPLNKGPSIINRDVDLYRLFRAVQKLGGYNRVTTQNGWKAIALRLGFTPATASITNLVKQAYKKFLHSFEEFNRKLGCTMVAHPRANRTKGRSLVRANSVASPKIIEVSKALVSSSSALASTSTVEESGNTSESSVPEIPVQKSKRKLSTNSGKVKALVEKFEEKEKEKEKEREREKEKEKDKDKEKEKDKEKDKEKVQKSAKDDSGSKKEKPVKKYEGEKRGRKRKEDLAEIKKEAFLEIPRIPSSAIASSSTSSQSVATSSASSTTATLSASSPSTSSSNTPGNQPDFPVEIGDKLKVYYHEQKVTYEAKVIEIAIQEGSPIYLVHYTGWNTRYDEWVRKDRIAENLTNTKTKKGKSSSSKVSTPTTSNTPSTTSASSSTTPTTTAAAATTTTNNPAQSTSTVSTPKTSKRRGAPAKNESNTTPSTATTSTPRSTTPSSSARNKSPATAATIIRRGTRGQPTTTNRRTSDVSSLSVQTDTTDTDSDEPIKKLTTNSNSLSSTSSSTSSTKVSTTAEAGSSSDAAAISDEFSNGASKGRDYDLNQIRSELKGFKELKSPTSPSVSETTTTTTTTTEVASTQTTAAENTTKSLGTKSRIEETIEKVIKSSSIDDSKSSESEMLSEEESSLSSNKAFSSSPITALVDQSPTPTPPIVMESIKSKATKSIDTNQSKIIEKVIEKTLLEKVDKKSEKIAKGAAASKNAIATGKIGGLSSAALSSASGETTSKFSFKSQGAEKPTSTAISTVQTSSTVQTPTIKSTKSNTQDKTAEKTNTISSSSATTTTTTSSSLTTPTKSDKKSSLSLAGESKKSILEKTPQKLGGTEKLKHFSSSNLTPAQNKILSKEAAKISSIFESSTSSKSAENDIYEFKESEPFEFESSSSRKHNSDVIPPLTLADIIPVPAPSAASSTSDEATPRKLLGKKTPRKQEVSEMGIGSKKTKKLSPVKTETEKLRQMKKEEKEVAALIPDSTVHLTPEKSVSTRIESTFDVLRKSPNFNLVSMRDDCKPTMESIVNKSVFTPIMSPPQTASVLQSSGDPGEDNKLLVPKSPSRLVDEKVMKIETSPASSELENVKKMLTDLNYGLEAPPKIEKPSSIADKVLKALNQQDAAEKAAASSLSSSNTTEIYSSSIVKSEKFDLSKFTSSVIHHPLLTPKVEPATTSGTSGITSISSSTNPSSTNLNEPPKIEVSNLLKKEIETTSVVKTKPILSSPEHKIDILDTIPPKNNDLTETIQKLESVIQKSSNIDRFDDDSSDSTDSEQRLVIEDESQSSEPVVPTTSQPQQQPLMSSQPLQSSAALINQQTDFETLIKAEMDAAAAASSIVSISSGAISSTSGGNKVYYKNEIKEENLSAKLSEKIGKKTFYEAYAQSAIQSSSSRFAKRVKEQHTILKDKEEIKKEDSISYHPQHQDSLSHQQPASQQQADQKNTESLSLLLCEETIPGSPAPVCGVSANNPKDATKVYAETPGFVSPQNLASDLKHVPMDIETMEHSIVTTTTTTTSHQHQQLHLHHQQQQSILSNNPGGSGQLMSSSSSTSIATTKIKNENVDTPDSSPRDSISQDESKSDSEDLLKKNLQGMEASPKKRRNRKTSECEISQKRRRTGTSLSQRGNSRTGNNGSDSEDNSDSVAFHASSSRSSTGRSPRPCQFNFLVSLDPALSSNQRISILKKKIQELRKTYNSIKAELASIDRRRKKLRRRERENKKNAKTAQQSTTNS